MAHEAQLVVADTLQDRVLMFSLDATVYNNVPLECVEFDQPFSETFVYSHEESTEALTSSSVRQADDKLPLNSPMILSAIFGSR